MALMDYGYNDPAAKLAREEAAKKHEEWLDEWIEIKGKDKFENSPNNDKSFYIKRRELIGVINASGALDGIRQSCRNYDLQNMRF